MIILDAYYEKSTRTSGTCQCGVDLRHLDLQKINVYGQKRPLQSWSWFAGIQPGYWTARQLWTLIVHSLAASSVNSEQILKAILDPSSLRCVVP